MPVTLLLSKQRRTAQYKLVPLQERSIYFLAPESDGAVFRLHSNIVVSSLRWRNDLSLSEKTINVSRWGTSLHPHDIVTAVHMDHFAGDSAGQGTDQEQGGVRHFGGIRRFAERRTLLDDVQHGIEVLHALGRQGADRAGRDGVHPDSRRPQVVSQIADAGLQG